MAHPPRAAAVVVAILIALGLAVTPVFLTAQATRHAAFVSVTDQSGVPVTNLGAADFVVREDKTIQEVLEVTHADDPMQIGLLIDNSQAAESFVRDYREALTEFVTAITSDPRVKGQHQIALVGLAGRPTILHDYSSNQAGLLKTVQSIFALPQTGTYLLDGIIEISQGISKRSAARPVVVAIATDGPELSDRPYNVVLRPLRDSGATLHVIRVGRPINVSHDRAVTIDEGTKTTGGSNEDILTSNALPNVLKRLATDLINQYRVTYARPARLVPPETISVSVNKPGLTARAVRVRDVRTTR